MNNLYLSKFPNLKISFFFIFLFFITFLFRSPTLFNDYYDVDELSAIVQTREYLSGRIPNIDFKESKLPVYHKIFKLSYKISPDHGWVIVHFFTIIIVFLTSIFIFLICKKLCNIQSGVIGAILYSILISSFNRHFMATNGEIVYNLPITAGLYILLLLISSKNILKNIIYFLLLLSMIIIASQIKFHGIILLIFTLLFFVIYLPYYKGSFTKKYLYILLSVFLFSIIILVYDYFTTNIIASKFFMEFYNKIFYATADKGINPLYFLIKFIHHQGLLFLWHLIIWLPVTLYIYKIIKEKKGKPETLQLGALFTLFILTYLMIFGGGARLYYHYFMAAYPSSCAIAGIFLTQNNSKYILHLKNNFYKFILIPGIFFILWNTKDIVIKHFYPGAFHNEGKILYWTRATLLGTWDDYLLPHKKYINTIKYIKKNTKQNEKIFVWGDGAYLYYFSNRRMGIYHVWAKNSVLKIKKRYSDNTKESILKAQSKEKSYIHQMEKNKPVLFIDTSKNGLANFNFEIPPLLKTYLRKQYEFETEIDKMIIYRRIKK